MAAADVRTPDAGNILFQSGGQYATMLVAVVLDRRATAPDQRI